MLSPAVLFFGFHSSPAFSFQAGSHCGDGISNVLQGQRLVNNIYSFWREEMHLEPPSKAEVSKLVLQRARENLLGFLGHTVAGR